MGEVNLMTREQAMRRAITKATVIKLPYVLVELPDGFTSVSAGCWAIYGPTSSGVVRAIVEADGRLRLLDSTHLALVK